MITETDKQAAESFMDTQTPDIKALEVQALSGYQLADILRKATEYVEKHKWGFYSDVDEEVKYSLGYLIRTVEVAHENHKKAMDEHFEKLEQTYNDYANKRKTLSNTLANLPKIVFQEIPYVNTESLQRLLDMAEKLSKLPDTQWNKLLELAATLKDK